MTTEADMRKAHVASDPEGEAQVCPSCGYSFGGELSDNCEPPSPPSADQIDNDFAAALRRSGRY